ncbi:MULTISPECIES: polysaccharide deacetylase family protein [unclassified Streptomyces]|uniref:polysaccharide deacetylase family protein n=1 Tax=unclassified Streptomyces TaxID=2593676 RepID=UPI002255BECC|nr:MULTISPECIES: polysaccharide deacetylase family protein [unclassified Streptomyces]MCX4883701.1 polysaccharide deacetylase family protein [Streptomyces sp. NBC_00847]MCX5423797.1 polysaccharide deacetylase family protein [Streptomyces sp. NBC_00078]
MTSTDRRTALRTGAGLLTAGALAAGCATNGAVAHSTTSAHPPTDPPTASAAPTPRDYPGRPAQLTHGPRTHPRVALTFHGQGDPAVAHSLLTAAEKRDARLTVLAVGTWLDEHPDVARRILDGGHDLGNHTQRHLAVNTMSEADARTEITACADRLRRLTGSIGTWFRPSRAPLASPLVVRLARSAGYPHVLSYDVDSLDYTRPGADAVVRTVLGEVRAGSVVSLHFGYPDTVAALPVVLEELAHRGLAAVTTTELFS